MLFRRACILTVIGLAAVGCRNPDDVTGRWTFSFPPTSMDLTLSSDGRYNGTVTTSMGSAAASGTYSSQNGTLCMSVPTVAGADGLPATFGGQIQLKMSPLSPSMIRLSDGTHEFGMERTGFGG